MAVQLHRHFLVCSIYRHINGENETINDESIKKMTNDSFSKKRCNLMLNMAEKIINAGIIYFSFLGYREIELRSKSS